jgi:hypothetical protein
VICVPCYSDYVGIYDPATDTYTRGDSHGEGDNAFRDGVLTSDGTVIFVPHNSNYVGIYDPDTDTYTRGDSHGEGDYAFRDGVFTSDGKVIFAPSSSDYVGIYSILNEFNKSLSDSQTLSESLLETCEFNRSLSDSQTPSESLLEICEFNRSLSDSQTPSELLYAGLLKHIVGIIKSIAKNINKLNSTSRDGKLKSKKED